ncbi:MAG: hypothetical protein WAW06_10095 [bacterium]
MFLPEGWEGETNMLRQPGVAESEEVCAIVESVLRYLWAASEIDTLCFLSFGTDSAGEWLDLPQGLIGNLPGLSLAIHPVSEAQPAANPGPMPGQIMARETPRLQGAFIRVELREWVAGSTDWVVLNLNTTAHEGVAKAAVRKSGSEWIVDEWWLSEQYCPGTGGKRGRPEVQQGMDRGDIQTVVA